MPLRIRLNEIGGLVCLSLVLFVVSASSTTPEEYKTQAIRVAVRAADRTYASLDVPPPNLSSRELFSAALAYCQAGTNAARVDRFFALAEQMQERNPTNRFYGNFRWSWGHDTVLDANAVDFCMQTAAMIWLHHREQLPAGARARLEKLIRLGIEGLRRHRVSEHYTNIALMNAGDLILLGEAFGDREVAREGYTRLDRFLLAMAECGTHEYNSPTYYGVDLDDLLLIEAFCREPRARQQARVLLEYFWTDIALNWFPPAAKMAGTRSRDYDYLRGLGVLDQHLLAQGWVDASSNLQPNNLLVTFGQWRPPASLRQMAESAFPRYIQQVWGPEPFQGRSHYLGRDVTLSVSGAGYGGRMDLPLTVDLPGPRTRTRTYFIPDERDDPYGKVRIQESRAHAKTLHLNPFWTAVQNQTDALGLVIYREADLNPTNSVLKSHLVFPLDVDSVWIAGKSLKWPPHQTLSSRVAAGESVILRQGKVAVGFRLIWSRNMDGQPASMECVFDGNSFGAARLTVDHQKRPGLVKTFPGAAFWVRVGTDLDDKTFEDWKRDFTLADAQVRVTTDQVNLSVPSRQIRLAAAAPFQRPSLLEPAFPRFLLAMNGDDLGRRLLAQVDPVRSFLSNNASVATIPVPAAGARWEAESGGLMPPFVAESSSGSPGKYIWMPAKPGEIANSTLGRATYPLRISRAAQYFLWGKVWAPTPENDSFFVRLEHQGEIILSQTAWHVGVRKDWTWVRFDPGQPLNLPAGDVKLHLGVREAGTRIDQLFLTSDTNGKPY